MTTHLKQRLKQDFDRLVDLRPKIVKDTETCLFFRDCKLFPKVRHPNLEANLLNIKPYQKHTDFLISKNQQKKLFLQ